MELLCHAAKREIVPFVGGGRTAIGVGAAAEGAGGLERVPAFGLAEHSGLEQGDDVGNVGVTLARRT